jgi:hypothetical protein
MGKKLGAAAAIFCMMRVMPDPAESGAKRERQAGGYAWLQMLHPESTMDDHACFIGICGAKRQRSGADSPRMMIGRSCPG